MKNTLLILGALTVVLAGAGCQNSDSPNQNPPPDTNSAVQQTSQDASNAWQGAKSAATNAWNDTKYGATNAWNKTTNAVEGGSTN